MVTKIVNQPLGMGIAGQPVRKEWIAAAIGLGTSILGGVLSSNAAKKAQAEQRKKEAAENAWYTRRYNEDYLDTSAGQKLVNKAKEAALAASKRADAATKVGGGTEAYKAMIKEQGNKLVADTMANAAVADQSNKRYVDDVHQKNLQQFANERIRIQDQKTAAITDAAQNASNALMSMEGSLASHRANLKGSSNSSTLSPLTSAQRQGMGVPLNEEDARLRAMLKGVQV